MSENRPNSGKFQKGQTGNPRGRPKVADDFKLKCRRVVDETVFAAWKEEVETRGDHWPKAAELLAAYGYGKPAQAVELTGAEGEPLVIEIRKGPAK